MAAGLFLAIATIRGTWLKPWLIAAPLGSTNAAVFAGLIFWGWLWGALGHAAGLIRFDGAEVIGEPCDDLAPLDELLGE
jgi:predicted PurR-regulated permease PerM